MTSIAIRQFGGRIPITGDRLIADNAATEALNAKLLSGEMRGFHAPGLLYTFPTGSPTYAKAAHIEWNGTGYWFGLNTADSDIVRCPLINDAYGRFYIVDPGNLPVTITQSILQSGGTPLLLGVPAPTNGPTVTAAAITGAAGEVVETRSYVYTYVSGFGEESAPSPPIEGIGDATNAWTISNMVVVVDNPTLRQITGINLYRTVTGSDGSTAFYLVAQFAVAGAPAGSAGDPFLGDYDGAILTDFDGTELTDPAAVIYSGSSSYSDTLTDTALTNTDIQLPSTYWLPPLAMDGLIAHPSGFLVGWSGNNIYASAVGYPHAWPAAYALAIDAQIIGMALQGTNILVMTDGSPRQMTGVSPDSLALYDYGIKEPCQSKGSIVAFPPAAVLYASNNGLVIIDWVGAHLSTNELMVRDVWQTEYTPRQIHAVRQNTAYIAFLGNGAGFVFDQQKKELGVVDLTTSFTSPAVTVDFATGDAIVFNNNSAYRWDDLNQPAVPYHWKSKLFNFPEPLNFGACRIDMDDTIAAALPGTNYEADSMLPDGVAVRFRVFVGVDQTLILDVNLNATTTFTMPSGFKSDLWQFEVIGQVPLYSIKLAETARELAKV